MHPNTAKKINAKWLEPVKLATYVMTNGGKNPPKPPIIDTIPFADPASFEKYDGTNLKIKPLPIPAQILIVKQPTVNNAIWSEIPKITAPIIIITKSIISTLTALNLSPSIPPIGLKNVVGAMDTPKRIPVSTLSNRK